MRTFGSDKIDRRQCLVQPQDGDRYLGLGRADCAEETTNVVTYCLLFNYILPSSKYYYHVIREHVVALITSMLDRCLERTSSIVS